MSQPAGNNGPPIGCVERILESIHTAIMMCDALPHEDAGLDLARDGAIIALRTARSEVLAYSQHLRIIALPSPATAGPAQEKGQ